MIAPRATPTIARSPTLKAARQPPKSGRRCEQRCDRTLDQSRV